MPPRARTAAAAVALLAAATTATALARPGASVAPATRPHTPMTTQHARGTFEVTLKPLTPYESEEGARIGRLSIDKQFRGDLAGTSKGEMLSAGTAVKGSAGYVAIERVRGTLGGRRGSFTLQHSGTMTRGAPQLTLTVVPDSGTDELVGLAGSMTIDVANGRHDYVLTYTLAPAGP